MQGTRAAHEEPWFRNPWVWLLIAIPAATVAGCIATIVLAILNPDYLVRDAASASPAQELRAEPAEP